MFFSAKNERRQNSDGHLRDVYRYLENLIKANPNIIFLLIEDKIHLKNKNDNGLIAQSETKVLEIDGGNKSALKTLNPFSLDGVYGLLDTLKKSVQGYCIHSRLYSSKGTRKIITSISIRFSNTMSLQFLGRRSRREKIC